MMVVILDSSDRCRRPMKQSIMYVAVLKKRSASVLLPYHDPYSMSIFPHPPTRSHQVLLNLGNLRGNKLPPSHLTYSAVVPSCRISNRTHHPRNRDTKPTPRPNNPETHPLVLDGTGQAPSHLPPATDQVRRRSFPRSGARIALPTTAPRR